MIASCAAVPIPISIPTAALVSVPFWAATPTAVSTSFSVSLSSAAFSLTFARLIPIDIVPAPLFFGLLFLFLLALVLVVTAVVVFMSMHFLCIQNNLVDVVQVRLRVICSGICLS